MVNMSQQLDRNVNYIPKTCSPGNNSSEGYIILHTAECHLSGSLCQLHLLTIQYHNAEHRFPF